MILALSCTLPIAAQTPGRALTFLPPAHWSEQAIRRLAGLGFIDVHSSVSAKPLGREQVAVWLDSAYARAAETGNAPQLRVTDWYRALFTQETRVDEGAWRSMRHIRLTIGGAFMDDELRPGTTVPVESGYRYPGPAQLRDQSNALAELEVYSQLQSWLAVGATTDLERDNLRFAPYLSAHVAGVDLWLGRRPFIIGSVPHESVVLGQSNQFDGFGASVRDGIRLPLLGLVNPELMLARLDRSGPILHPYFHAARLTLKPRPELVIGMNRAAIFGGEDHLSVTPIRVLLMLLGYTDTAVKDSDFENQVASIDLLWRVRARDTPILLYLEYGADDAGFAFVQVPALMAGLQILARPELTLGVEALQLTNRCCKHPSWYLHGALPDGWSSGGKLLGHSLGGAGREIAVSADLALPTTPLLANGRWYARDRSAENMFAPDRVGFSTGGTLELMVPWRNLRLELRGELERGDDWQRSRGLAQLTAHF